MFRSALVLSDTLTVVVCANYKWLAYGVIYCTGNESEKDGTKWDFPPSAATQYMTANVITGPDRQESSDHKHIIDAELAYELTELIDTMECVQWYRVPGVSASTAATFTRVLIESRQEVQRGDRV